MRHSIARLAPLSILLLAAACQADLKCGPLEVDEVNRRCVCPNGGEHREGLCYLPDGSVAPLDGMVVGDAGEVPDDAHVDIPDAFRPDAGTDAGEPDACVASTYYRDVDGDGFGDRAQSMGACEPPDGYVTDDTDCDDACEDCNPDGTEVCDEAARDEDCDGMPNLGCDCTAGSPDLACGTSDEGECVRGVQRCVDGEYGACEGAVEPIDELCNGLDDDCDGRTDEGVQTTFYRDADGDGRGSAGTTMQACSAPSGFVASSNDCNDACATCYPGRTEVCDGLNNDCDAGTDEGVLNTFYRDMDGDSYGTPSMPTTGCTAPAGYVANDDDCNDSCMSCRPGGTEVCDGQNNDCDSATDEGVLVTFYRDADGDTYGNPSMVMQACAAAAGYVTRGGDCNDACDVCFPGNVETCDGLDNNCAAGADEGVRTTYYADCDGDGYAATAALTTQACMTPSAGPTSCTTGGWTSRAPGAQPDCHDTNPNVHPGQIGYFATPIAGVPASRDYDYDCDGTEAQEVTRYRLCMGVSSCANRPGWDVSVTAWPACGGQADYVTCDGSCDEVVASRTQGCR